MLSEFENQLYEIYPDFFRHAEANRRWNIKQDTPRHNVNPNLHDKISYVLKGCTSIEMYLPGFSSKNLQMIGARPRQVAFMKGFLCLS